MGPGTFSNEEQITMNEAGLFIVEVFAKNGCSILDSVWVEIDTVPPLLEIIDVPSLNCSITEISPQVNLPDTYESLLWSGQNLNSPDILVNINTPGEYTLELVGNNGCTTLEAFTVMADTLAPDFSFSVNTIDCNSPNAHIVIESNPLIQNGALVSNDSIIQEGFDLLFEPISDAFVEVTGINGCTSFQPVDLVFDTTATPIIASAYDINCSMEPVQIEVQNSNEFAELNLSFGNNILGRHCFSSFIAWAIHH